MIIWSNGCTIQRLTITYCHGSNPLGDKIFEYNGKVTPKLGWEMLSSAFILALSLVGSGEKLLKY